MKRLKANDIYGIWAGMTMCWNEDYSFDETNYVKNIETMCKTGVHGIYTTGSTGEFYALNFDEFKLMVDIQNDICGKHNKPLQIGCCSDNTRDTLQMIEYAASKENVGGVQVNLPYWMELTDREVLQFFKDIYEAQPEMPLVHYNIPRTKRFLNGHDYLKVKECAPSLVGVKYTFAPSNFTNLQTAMDLNPDLSFFVGENVLASAAALGVKGNYSALISTNPDFMLKMYSYIAEHEWEKAFEMQKFVNHFYNDVFEFVTSLGEGGIDPVFDKGLSVAAGFSAGSQRTRKPYIGWSDESVKKVSEWLKKNYPQLVYN